MRRTVVTDSDISLAENTIRYFLDIWRPDDAPLIRTLAEIACIASLEGHSFDEEAAENATRAFYTRYAPNNPQWDQRFTEGDGLGVLDEARGRACHAVFQGMAVLGAEDKKGRLVLSSV